MSGGNLPPCGCLFSRRQPAFRLRNVAAACTEVTEAAELLTVGARNKVVSVAKKCHCRQTEAPKKDLRYICIVYIYTNTHTHTH